MRHQDRAARRAGGVSPRVGGALARNVALLQQPRLRHPIAARLPDPGRALNDDLVARRSRRLCWRRKPQEQSPMSAGERALEFVQDGMTVGLGTGRAANAFVEALGRRVAEGLRVRGVPTSARTEALAKRLGIALVTLAEAGSLDLCVDGADEVDEQLDLIKGYGGALVREKIVAASARQLVILIGPEKLVKRVGERGKLPVEIVPFGLPLCTRRLEALGCKPVRRASEADASQPYVTDNGNWILDCGIATLADAAGFEREVLAIPGVVGTGLFVGMADAIVVEWPERDEVRTRSR